MNKQVVVRVVSVMAILLLLVSCDKMGAINYDVRNSTQSVIKVVRTVADPILVI